jgi:hypothetical protein
MAGTADEFTKKRLLVLASKYEARLGQMSQTAKKLTIAPVKIHPDRRTSER